MPKNQPTPLEESMLPDGMAALNAIPDEEGEEIPTLTDEVGKVDPDGPKKVNVPIDPKAYTKVTSPSGGKSLCNGDDVAMLLAGIPAASLYDAADKIAPDNAFRAKYAHLNTGMQRMNLGNRFRGFISKRDKLNEAEELLATKEERPPKIKLSGIEALTKALAPAREVADKLDAEAKAMQKAKAEAKSKEEVEA